MTRDLKSVFLIALFALVLVVYWFSSSFSSPRAVTPPSSAGLSSSSSSSSSSPVPMKPAELPATPRPLSPSSAAAVVASSSSSSSSSLFSPFLKPKTASSLTATAIDECKSYTERYAECISIRKQFDADQRRELFRTVAGMGRDRTIKEIVLYRMHKRKWIPEHIRDFESIIKKKGDVDNNNNNNVNNAQDEETETIKKQMDMWLHTCSFIIETARDGDRPRDVVIYTLEDQEDSVPSEFQPLVRSHSESTLTRLYGKKTFYYGGGYHRGDLAAHLFLKMHAQYNFLWLMEFDLRFVGVSWGEFLSRSRRYSSHSVNKSALGMKFQPVAKTRQDLIRRIQKNIMPPNTSLSFAENEQNIEKLFHLPRDYSDGKYFSDARSDAHLIWFYPPLVNYGYMKYNCSLDRTQPGCSKETVQRYEPDPQWIFTGRHYFIGKWRDMFLGNKRWYGAFGPGFGASRTLFESIHGEIEKYASGHMNQEASLPIVASKYKLKAVYVLNNIVNSQVYMTWLLKNESAPYYEGWSPVGGVNGVINARTMKTGYSKLRLKNRNQNFDQRDCLSDFLFHPVKY